jgi:hypothetical protein
MGQTSSRFQSNRSSFLPYRRLRLAFQQARGQRPKGQILSADAVIAHGPSGCEPTAPRVAVHESRQDGGSKL